MARSRQNQSKHDTMIRIIVARLEDQGYDVQADHISGYPEPDTIGGFRPDVIGKKGRERKIYEVETSDSVGSARDLLQAIAFRQAADRSEYTTFRRIVV